MKLFRHETVGFLFRRVPTDSIVEKLSPPGHHLEIDISRKFKFMFARSVYEAQGRKYRFDVGTVAQLSRSCQSRTPATSCSFISDSYRYMYTMQTRDAVHVQFTESEWHTRAQIRTWTWGYDESKTVRKVERTRDVRNSSLQNEEFRRNDYIDRWFFD